MRYRLREGLHYCVSAGRVIFLDVYLDTYFALPRATDTAFQALCSGSEVTASQWEALQTLVRKELISKSATGAALPSHLALCRANLLSTFESVRPSFGTVVRAFRAQASSALALRLRSFSAIIATTERRRARVERTRGDSRDAPIGAERRIYAEVSAAFAKTNLVFRPADRCLARSLAFVAVCHGYGLLPSLVFGVRTNPFLAHCWVQAEDRILHDDSGEAALYTPILVV